MNKARFSVLIAFLAGAVMVAAPLAANSRSLNERTTVTGVVTRVDSRSQLTIRLDDDRDEYRVRADEATVTIAGRNSEVRDIREGDRVTIYGDVRNDYTIDAYSIDVRDSYGGGYGNDYGRWETGRTVTIDGSVRSTDTRRDRFDLSTSRGTVTVYTDRDTDFRDRVRSLRDLRTGDFVTVTGRVDGSKSMRADLVSVGSGGYDYDRGSRTGNVLVGEVSQAANNWDRDIGVLTSYGETDVQVPKNIPVLRNGRSVSIHEIRTGEDIRVTGRWRGNVFVADRVEVGYGRDYGRDNGRDYGRADSFYGTIDRISSRNQEFRLRVGSRYYTVRARSARLYDANGRTFSFRDLRDRQSVRVFGDLSGGTIFADRIERGGFYY